MSTAPVHSREYRIRRFFNWFPMGLLYAFLYWGRYNLTVAKSSLGELMTNAHFGTIFGVGTTVYAFSFLINGPITDKLGGKRGILLAAVGTVFANVALGLTLQRAMVERAAGGTPSVLLSFTVLYAINMYFQSFGAAAIVKVNAAWFHVRERGGFSGIFGAMISSGIFFAFDVSSRVLGLAKGKGDGGMDAIWWVFFAPACAVVVLGCIEVFLLKDAPSNAGFEDFDTGDASSGEADQEAPSAIELYKRILGSPVILTICFIEFCTGILRNGTMHWVDIYLKTDAIKGGLGLARDHFLRSNWGLILMVAGIIGGNIAGLVSDKIFASRRGPAAGGLYLVLCVASIAMVFTLKSAVALGICAFIMQIAVIGTHGLLSGTATMDFGGRKAAATAVGAIDGFVYLGTAVQSFALGALTTRSWSYWPPFLVPFAFLGFFLCTRIWHAIPKGAKSAH